MLSTWLDKEPLARYTYRIMATCPERHILKSETHEPRL
jgi:hypothetical protein